MRVHSRSRRFRDLSVAAKMTLAVGLADVDTLETGVLGLRALSTAADRTDQMHQQNVLGAQLAQEIRFQFLSSRFNSTSATYSTDPAAKQNDLTARDEARAALSDAAKKLVADTEPTPRVRAAVKTAMADIAQYIELGKQLDALGAAGKATSPEFIDLRTNKVGPLSGKIVEELQALSELESTTAAQQAAAAHHDYTSTRTALLVVMIVGALLALVFGALVARGITRALERVRASAERLAEGDLTQRAGVDQRDEVGRMAEAIDAAQDSLRDVMAAVVASADAVAASSEELSAASAQSSSSAQETSAQSGVVASAAEEVSRNVQYVAAGSELMGASIGEISSYADQASEVDARSGTAAQTTIAPAVEEQTATTTEMSRSVQEAAGGTGQIAENITSVSTAADSTTQALTQTRTAVDELSRMAADLRSTVGRFSY